MPAFTPNETQIGWLRSSILRYWRPWRESIGLREQHSLADDFNSTFDSHYNVEDIATWVISYYREGKWTLEERGYGNENEDWQHVDNPPSKTAFVPNEAQVHWLKEEGFQKLWGPRWNGYLRNSERIVLADDFNAKFHTDHSAEQVGEWIAAYFHQGRWVQYTKEARRGDISSGAPHKGNEDRVKMR
jgi:hypothetical protein